MKNNGFTWHKRMRGFAFAINGIILMIRNETNARIHTAAVIVACMAGWALNISVYEWMAVTAAAAGVLATEAINSAIEALADRVSTDYDEKIKNTKDLAAGGVLIMALAAAIIGGIVFIPKIINICSIYCN